MTKKSNPDPAPLPCLPLQTFPIKAGASRIAIDVVMGDNTFAMFSTSSLIVLHIGQDDEMMFAGTEIRLPSERVDGLTVTNEGAAAVLEVRPFDPPPETSEVEP